MMPAGGGFGTAFNKDISDGEFYEMGLLWLMLVEITETKKDKEQNVKGICARTDEVSGQ